MSLKMACYPVIADYLLTIDKPVNFIRMCREEFDRVFYSPKVCDHANEEKRLGVIFKGTHDVIAGYLDAVDFSQLSEDFWMEFIYENPILRELTDLR